MITILLTSFVYFVLTFLAGFVLGISRVFFLVPVIGERYAELIEMPVMLLVIYLSAKLVVTRFPALTHRSAYLVTGGIALGLLLLLEFTLVLRLRDLSLPEYFASRDPLAGSAYVLSLLLFAIMPYLVAKRHASR